MSAHDFAQRQHQYLVIARLLSYPNQELIDNLDLFDSAIEQVTGEAGDSLRHVISTLRTADLLTVQKEYVAAFDMRRRCCLYLSYYLNGDTRKRGMALWRFQETYRLNGWQPAEGELADYLPMLLEFAASGPDEESVALVLLEEHAQGLVVLQQALEQFAPMHATVIAALLQLLPDLSPDQRDGAAALIANGPPVENVGLEPFGQELLTIGVRR